MEDVWWVTWFLRGTEAESFVADRVKRGDMKN